MYVEGGETFTQTAVADRTTTSVADNGAMEVETYDTAQEQSEEKQPHGNMSTGPSTISDAAHEIDRTDGSDCTESVDAQAHVQLPSIEDSAIDTQAAVHRTPTSQATQIQAEEQCGTQVTEFPGRNEVNDALDGVGNHVLEQLKTETVSKLEPKPSTSSGTQDVVDEEHGGHKRYAKHTGRVDKHPLPHEQRHHGSYAKSNDVDIDPTITEGLKSTEDQVEAYASTQPSRSTDRSLSDISTARRYWDLLLMGRSSIELLRLSPTQTIMLYGHLHGMEIYVQLSLTLRATSRARAVSSSARYREEQSRPPQEQKPRPVYPLMWSCLQSPFTPSKSLRSNQVSHRCSVSRSHRTSQANNSSNTSRCRSMQASISIWTHRS